MNIEKNSYRKANSIMSALHENRQEKLNIEESNVLDEDSGEAHKITDPKLKKDIDEMAALHAQIKKYENEIKKLATKQSDLAKDVLPELEKIYRETEARIFRTEKAILSLGSLSHTRTTTQWKKLYDVLYNKVNVSIKGVMDELKETVVSTSEISTQYKVKVDENLNENVLSKIKDFVRGIKKKVMGWMRTLNRVDKDIAKLEQLSQEMSEAYQRGRRNNLSEIEGKTVTSVEDEGKTSISITFDDGSRLEVSGSTEVSSDGIYYKLYKGSGSEESEEGEITLSLYSGE